MEGIDWNQVRRQSSGKADVKLQCLRTRQMPYSLTGCLGQQPLFLPRLCETRYSLLF